VSGAVLHCAFGVLWIYELVCFGLDFDCAVLVRLSQRQSDSNIRQSRLVSTAAKHRAQGTHIHTHAHTLSILIELNLQHPTQLKQEDTGACVAGRGSSRSDE
jgi:hypothetical protein